MAAPVNTLWMRLNSEPMPFSAMEISLLLRNTRKKMMAATTISTSMENSTRRRALRLRRSSCDDGRAPRFFLPVLLAVGFFLGIYLLTPL